MTPRGAPAVRNRAAPVIVGRVARRYLLVVIAIAALVVLDQSVVQPMLIRVGAYLPAINVAGRQRMLSQRLTKVSLALRDASDPASRALLLDELRKSLTQWTLEHDALALGDMTLGIRPIRSAELNAEWTKLATHYEAMVTATRQIINSQGAAAIVDKVDSPVTALVQHEARYLPTMDRIVKLMEERASVAVMRLRTLALSIAGLIVALLIGLGWLVVRPATRALCSQFDDLEARVAERTSELAAALARLQREIRDRSETEAKNQRLAHQLAHAGRVTTMGHLTAGLAHELNQPLAAITNYTEACEVLLERNSSTAELARVGNLVHEAKRAALRAGQIVRRMRNFVRPNVAARSEVGCNALITEIIELCRTETATAQAEIVVELAAEDDIVVADAIQIQQVLVNLVQNALQAMTTADCENRTISIRTSNLAGELHIEVADTGPGFEDGADVFTPFHSTKADGLGIGLSLCRSIVEDHRGRIWTELHAGRGAAVSFTLPLSAEHAPSHRHEPDYLCC